MNISKKIEDFNKIDTDNTLKNIEKVELIEECFSIEDIDDEKTQKSVNNNYVLTHSNPTNEDGLEITPAKEQVLFIIRKYSNGSISRIPIAKIPIYPSTKKGANKQTNYLLIKTLSDKEARRFLLLALELIIEENLQLAILNKVSQKIGGEVLKEAIKMYKGGKYSSIYEKHEDSINLFADITMNLLSDSPFKLKDQISTGRSILKIRQKHLSLSENNQEINKPKFG